jgi:hypothetical protein
MTDASLIFPALGALYQALGPWVEALLRFTVGAAMVPHGLRMCLGYFKGTGGPVEDSQAAMRSGGSSLVFSTSTGFVRAADSSRAYSADT